MTDKTAVEAMARGIARCNYPSGTNADIEEMWTGFEFDAQAALTAHTEWLRGNGYAVVPVEPTEAMLKAGHQQIDWCRDSQDTATYDHPSQNKQGGTNCKTDVSDAYRAMINAAQEKQK